MHSYIYIILLPTLRYDIIVLPVPRIIPAKLLTRRSNLFCLWMTSRVETFPNDGKDKLDFFFSIGYFPTSLPMRNHDTLGSSYPIHLCVFWFSNLALVISIVVHPSVFHLLSMSRSCLTELSLYEREYPLYKSRVYYCYYYKSSLGARYYALEFWRYPPVNIVTKGKTTATQVSPV